jgi:hypothetical protein
MFVREAKAARNRKIAASQKRGCRESYAEARPEMVELARQSRPPIQIAGWSPCRTSRPLLPSVAGSSAAEPRR